MTEAALAEIAREYLWEHGSERVWCFDGGGRGFTNGHFQEMAGTS